MRSLLAKRLTKFFVLFISLLYGFTKLASSVWWPSDDLAQERRQIKDWVDNTLDEVASDILLTGEMIRLKPSRKDLARIFGLQALISCRVHEGRWQTIPYRDGPAFVASKNCTTPGFGRTNRTMLSSIEICRLLSGKKILFVGPGTTYHLHSLWLKSLEVAENRIHACPGQEYCTFHHICRSPTGADAGPKESVERKKKMPSVNILQATKSAILQYTLSTTLYASKEQKDPAYLLPKIDQETGIRICNNFWLRNARKANIVLLSRGPVPAPASTYGSGNWSFATSLCDNQDRLDVDLCKASVLHYLVNAALYVTIYKFLPSVLDILHKIVQDPEMRGSVHMWQGSWYIQPSCAQEGLPRDMRSVSAFWTDGSHDAKMDLWSFYYNSQVYMHDRVLPRLLPYFNFTHVPLTMSTYNEPSYISNPRPNFSSQHAKDCLRAPWSNFGQDGLEKVVFGALSAVLSI